MTNIASKNIPAFLLDIWKKSGVRRLRNDNIHSIVGLLFKMCTNAACTICSIQSWFVSGIHESCATTTCHSTLPYYRENSGTWNFSLSWLMFATLHKSFHLCGDDEVTTVSGINYYIIIYEGRLFYKTEVISSRLKGWVNVGYPPTVFGHLASSLSGI